VIGHQDLRAQRVSASLHDIGMKPRFAGLKAGQQL
jgi:hypothetical protein